MYIVKLDLASTVTRASRTSSREWHIGVLEATWMAPSEPRGSNFFWSGIVCAYPENAACRCTVQSLYFFVPVFAVHRRPPIFFGGAGEQITAAASLLPRIEHRSAALLGVLHLQNRFDPRELKSFWSNVKICEAALRGDPRVPLRRSKFDACPLSTLAELTLDPPGRANQQVCAARRQRGCTLQCQHVLGSAAAGLRGVVLHWVGTRGGGAAAAARSS